MKTINFMNRKVDLSVKYWGRKLMITIRGGFNLSELKTMKQEAMELIEALGCGGGKVEFHINETRNRLTIEVTPPEKKK